MKTFLIITMLLALPLKHFTTHEKVASQHNSAMVNNEPQDEMTGVTGVITVIVPGTVVTLQNHLALHTTHVDALNGQFLFREVQEGEYTLNVYLPDSEQPYSVEGIKVVAGEITNVGFITPDIKKPI